MLRVCMVGLIAGGHSGIPRYTSSLIEGLGRVAPEFPSLSLRLLTTPDVAERTPTGALSVEVAGGRLGRAREGPGRILAEQLQARRAEAELLHFFDLSGPLFAPSRSFVTTVHDAAALRGFEPLRMMHKRLLQPWAIRRAAAVVAVSCFSRDEAVNVLGADPGRVTVIHSGPGLVADEPGCSPADDAAAASAPYVLYLGNLSVHKNLPFLVGAFEASGIDGRLVLAGRPGSRFEELRRAVELSPARERIEIREGVSDVEVARLYRGASMLVLPSLYEGFGFTPLEAMARGCPVLASDIPALREISGDGAWLLPARDQAAWTAAMSRVAGDRTLREDLRERGSEVVRRYTWERAARRLCELFTRAGARPR